MQKNFSSSATSDDDVIISMGADGVSTRISIGNFSVTLSSSLERKLAAVSAEPAMCVILQLNCNTSSHAFHSADGNAFVWKKTCDRFVICQNS